MHFSVFLGPCTSVCSLGKTAEATRVYRYASYVYHQLCLSCSVWTVVLAMSVVYSQMMQQVDAKSTQEGHVQHMLAANCHKVEQQLTHNTVLTLFCLQNLHQFLQRALSSGTLPAAVYQT